MATKNSQRIVIWVITIVMTVGSLGAYFMVILDTNNQQKTQEEQQKMAQNQQPTPQALEGFEAKPFDAAGVTELKKEDLSVGSGEEVPMGAEVVVNYFGYLPDGTIFDSSRRDGQLAPLTLGLDGVIEGWKHGVPGMKVGGKRLLHIPAGMAYGAEGSQNIPPNTPIAFVVEVVEVKK